MADEPAQQRRGSNADEWCMPNTRHVVTSSVEAVDADGVEFYRRHRRAALTPPQYGAAQGFSDRLGQTVLDELEDYRWSLEQSHYQRRQGNYQFARADVHTAIGVLSVRLDISIADAGARLRARAYIESRSISSLAHDIVHRRADFTDERA